MRYKTYTGIVLKRTSWRESDEILTVWTMEEGKIRLLARGLKQQASKLRAGLAPLAWIEISTSSAFGFPVIIGTRTIRTYNAVARALPQLACAFNIFEYVLRSTPDRQTSPGLSVLLREALDALEVIEEEQIISFRNAFLTRFITIMGFGLALDRCATCGHSLGPNQRTVFSYLQCGLVCQDCKIEDRTSVEVSPQVVMHLLSLQTATRLGVKTAADMDVVSGAQKVLTETMHFILEREIQSSRFLDTRISQAH